MRRPPGDRFRIAMPGKVIAYGENPGTGVRR